MLEILAEAGVLASCRDEKLFELLMSYGVDINATNQDGETILHDIAWTEADIMAAVAAPLIARGCDVNARDSRGQRPLHAAAAAGNIGLMNILLSLGAEMELRDDVGQAPIFGAGTVDSVEFLVQRGARADARDDNGLPALYCAFFWRGFKRARRCR